MHSEQERLTGRVDALEESTHALRETVKQQEPSLVRALATLLSDWRACRRGERDDIDAALLGVIFAYLRPRILVTAAGLAAVLLGGLQFWLILNQNRLIDLQTQASRVAAISSLEITANDSAAVEVAMSQIVKEKPEVLLLIATGSTDMGYVAQGALALQASLHNSIQTSRVTDLLLTAHVASTKRLILRAIEQGVEWPAEEIDLSFVSDAATRAPAQSPAHDGKRTQEDDRRTVAEAWDRDMRITNRWLETRHRLVRYLKDSEAALRDVPKPTLIDLSSLDNLRRTKVRLGDGPWVIPQAVFDSDAKTLERYLTLWCTGGKC